jgi:DNA-binding transcriptional LysR family regulator
MGCGLPEKTDNVLLISIKKFAGLMDALTLDQVTVFLSVVEHGSFSAAARELHRAQSAVTYLVHKLEEQIGTPLFDRSQYRPVLTEAGRALLPKARRISEAVGAFRMQARGIAGGLEPELALAVSSFFPMQVLAEALHAFHARFPSVGTRIFVESLGGVSRLVESGGAPLGIATGLSVRSELMRRVPLVDVELVVVAAPDHPLARLPGRISPEQMREHVQLVLTDRIDPHASADYGVFASQTWRIADLSAKHALLVAGLGFGGMPLHLVRHDLSVGTLVRLEITEWDGADRPPAVPMCVTYRTDTPLGPASTWMLEHLIEITHRRLPPA